MKTNSLTAVKLRIGLIILLLLAAAAGVGVFMLGYDKLVAYAKENQTIATQAAASENELSNLARTKADLERQKDVVDRAKSLVAESRQYNYQNDVIRDIYRFASTAGIEITNVQFPDAATMTRAGVTTQSATPATSTAPGGIKTTTASISLKSPTNYDNLMKFIYMLEESLFKIRIVNLGIARQSEAKPDEVTSDAIQIEVFIR